MDAVKEKMHNPARAKCECVSLTETIAKVIPGTKQEFDEDLADCAKRLKQAKDVFKQSVDTKMSFEFVVHTQEHKDAGSNAAAQESCERRGIQQMDDPFVCEECRFNQMWQSVDQIPRGMFIGEQSTHPSAMLKATDVLTDHRWDKEHGQKIRDRAKQQRNESRAKEKEDSSKGSQQQNGVKSDSQFKQEWTELTCCCCGKKGHVAPDCRDRDKIPRNEWKCAKGMQMCVEQEEETDKEQPTDDEDDKNNNDEEPEKKQEKTGVKKKGWSCLQMDSAPMQSCYEQDEEEMETTDVKQTVMSDTGSTFASVANEELLTGVHNSA